MSAVFVRDARLAVSYWVNFALGWLGISVEVVILSFIATLVAGNHKFGFGGSVSYFQFVVINVAFVRFQSTALTAFSDAIRDGQTYGTLEVILATPTQLPLIVLSAGLWAFVYTALQTAIYLAVATAFGLDLHRVNLAGALILLVLTITAVSPLGILAAAATIRWKKTGFVTWAMGSLTILGSGVYFPWNRLPHALQIVGWLLPITHALNGFRAAVAGASTAQLLSECLWLFVATLGLMPVALLTFNSAVRDAKMQGTLGQY
ncbi:MAG: ABC transporter permease [Candidatus Eremiobacteraeota bacterium]|nr:ABC transporter permease [Candidatus Eremiobacteraeota bacterium]